MSENPTTENFTEELFLTGGSKSSVPRNMSFIDYITTTTSNEKSQLLNLIQYGGLIIIPLLIILKLMKLYVPPEDPYKSSTELLVEVVVQLVVIIVAFFIIHKLVLYVPTYSKVEYDNISLLSGILPLFFLMFTVDTKLSQKTSLLFDRLLFAIGLKKEAFDDEIQEGNTGKRVGGETSSIQVAQCGSNTQLDAGIDDRLGVLPTKRDPGNEMNQPQQQGGMDTAINGSFMDDQGPMPANSVLGGSAF